MGRRRITQKHMAEWLGISHAVASDRVNGKTPYTLDELGILSEYLSVPAVALVTEPTHLR